MATLQITSIMLECDGCGTWYGAENPFPNPVEARAAAYADGWRFPNHVGAKGRALHTTSDVCPDCVPTWEPQPRTARIRHVNREETMRRMPRRTKDGDE